ncbi:MAG TPA: metallophosphoesterase [Gammaproteobacteria bacterium]|nr:metallophosphoesterase [Gammaproteobacteria bacterium]
MQQTETNRAAAGPARAQGKASGPGLRLAHLSDPHLTSLDSVRWRQLLSKRVLGYLSWRQNRRHEHRSEVLDALVADLRRQHPDHVLVTGDLTHIGLPQEFRQARGWLEGLGSAAQVTVVPGNHDAYAHHVWRDTFALWEPWMRSDAAAPGGGRTALFPSLRVRRGVAIIGLSSAVPSGPFFATGRLGREQLGRLETLLRHTGGQGLFRVVALHHPPCAGSEKWRKRLTDAAALEAVIARAGAELVLHGHSHRLLDDGIETPGGRVPVAGIPSASALGRRPGREAQYSFYDIHRDAQGWTVRMEVRAYRRASHDFVRAHEHHFSPARMARTKA